MACEFFLLSSIWFVVVISWMETINMWLFLCHLMQDGVLLQYAERFNFNQPDHILYIIIRVHSLR